jgi:PAS domain S-box-containing protein
VGLRDVAQVLAERERAQRLQLSMDRAAIGMAITTLRGDFEYVNPALARMLGYRQADLVGMSFRDITHPEDRDASEAMLHRLTGDGVESLSLRKRYVALGGQTLWVDLAVAAARRDDGDLDHFVAQIVDVTAEVEYAEALERTVRRFRLLAENASDVVYETDAAGVIRWISPSVQNVLGWEPDVVAGSPDTDLLESDQEQEIAQRRERVDAGFSMTGQLVRYRTAFGRTAWMSSKAHPIVDSGGSVTGTIVGLRDVSAEVAARQELSQLQEQLGKVASDRGGGDPSDGDAAR